MNTPLENKIGNVRMPYMIFMPGHPDADSQGFVKMPNVKILYEMAGMIERIRNQRENGSILNIGKNRKQKAE